MGYGSITIACRHPLSPMELLSSTGGSPVAITITSTSVTITGTRIQVRFCELLLCVMCRGLWGNIQMFRLMAKDKRLICVSFIWVLPGECHILSNILASSSVPECTYYHIEFFLHWLNLPSLITHWVSNWINQHWLNYFCRQPYININKCKISPSKVW